MKSKISLICIILIGGCSSKNIAKREHQSSINKIYTLKEQGNKLERDGNKLLKNNQNIIRQSIRMK